MRRTKISFIVSAIILQDTKPDNFYRKIPEKELKEDIKEVKEYMEGHFRELESHRAIGLDINKITVKKIKDKRARK